MHSAKMLGAVLFLILSLTSVVHSFSCGINFQIRYSYFQDPVNGTYLKLYEKRVKTSSCVDPQEFPWQVRLEIRGRDNYNYECGGAVLNERWIITSAHCAFLAQSCYDIIAVMGVENLHQSTGRELSIPIDFVRTHPQYNPISFDFDFALLRTAKPIDMTFAKAICLPKSCHMDESCQPGDVAIASGWGIRELVGRSSSKQTKDVLQLQDDIACLYSWPQTNPPGFSRHKWCTGKPAAESTCAGDLGGPLICTRKLPGNAFYFQLIGIATPCYQASCGQYRRKSPVQGFGKVCKALPWIQETFERHN